MKKLSVIIASVITVMLSIGIAFPPKTAFAGVSSQVLLDKTCINGNELSTAVFERIVGDVGVKDGVIAFGEDDFKTDVNARLNLSSKINETENVETLVALKTDLVLNGIADGGEFVFAFGLSGRKSAFGDTNSVEIIVGRGADYFIKTAKVNGDGSRSAFAEKTFSLPENKTVTLNATVYVDERIDVTLTGNGTETVCDKTPIGTAPIGYFAFGFRNAKCKVRVKDITLKTFSYAAPKNVDAVNDLKETFDNGEYNARLWYSYSTTGAISPSYLHVEDRAEGDATNGVLRFNNVGHGYIGTKYNYSNFELDFDLMDVSYPTFDEGGNLVTTGNGAIYILTGVKDYKEGISTSIVGAGDRFSFRIGGYVNNHDYSKVSKECRVMKGNATLKFQAMSDEYNPYNGAVANGRKSNVKVIMKDMVLSLWIKFEDSSWEYDLNGDIVSEPVISYVFDTTPTGCVRIGACNPESMSVNGLKESAIGNFSVDNITIKNLDDESVKQTVTGVGKTSNLYGLGEDYPYEDTDDSADLLMNNLSKESRSGCGAKTEGGILPFLLSLSVAAITRITVKRRKNNEIR